MSSIENLKSRAEQYRQEALRAKMRGDVQTGIQKLRIAKQYEKLITKKEEERELRELEREMGGPSSSSYTSLTHPTLSRGHQLHDMAREMRENIERSTQILRDSQRDLEERNVELRRLAELTGISVDEYLGECPVRPVAPPIGPPPAQPSKLKVWLKKFWQSINCAGPQGGKKTRKHKKYRKRTKKHNKQVIKTRKYKNKKYIKRTRKH
jgi:hypothetical protein